MVAEEKGKTAWWWGGWLAMARRLRIEYNGAVYHVMARGKQGRPIFADDLDRRMSDRQFGW
jgi:hypothetical protein